MSRLLMVAMLLGATIGLPYAASRLSDDGAKVSTPPPGVSAATLPLIGASRPSPQAAMVSTASPNSVEGPGSLVYKSTAPLEGTRFHSIDQVLRFDITKDWVYRNWARKSTWPTDVGLVGVRVPLVTGTDIAALAGSLTYFFNAQGQLEHISFRGTTGDTTALVGFLTRTYQFQWSSAPVGEQVYQVKSGNRVQSELRTRPEAVLWTTAPHSSVSVELELARPGSKRFLPPRVPALAIPQVASTPPTAAKLATARIRAALQVTIRFSIRFEAPPQRKRGRCCGGGGRIRRSKLNRKRLACHSRTPIACGLAPIASIRRLTFRLPRTFRFRYAERVETESPAILPCPPRHREEALALVLCDLAPSQRREIAIGLNNSAAGADSTHGLYVAVRGERLCGAVWGQPQPGKTAVLWPPQLIPDENKGTAYRLAEAALRELDSLEVSMAQVLLLPREDAHVAVMASIGFQRLADLLYLTCEADHFNATNPPHNELVFVPYGDSQQARFAQVVEQTYENTLDCAALNGVRSMADVLDGYRATGTFRAENWLIVCSAGHDVGVLLLADHAQAKHWELMYMGLVPAARGHGWGREIVLHAQRLAYRAGTSESFLRSIR